MKEIQFENPNNTGSPNTQEWLRWRDEGLTASLATIFARFMDRKLPAYIDVNKQIMKKAGLDNSKEYVNEAMRYGSEKEAEALEWYKEQTGENVSFGFGEMDEYAFIKASFDGIVKNDKGEIEKIVEIKTPFLREGGETPYLVKWAEEQMKKQETDLSSFPYFEQMLHQGIVAWGSPEKWDGKNSVEVVIYTPSNQDERKKGIIVKDNLFKYKEQARSLLNIEKETWEDLKEIRALMEEGKNALATVYADRLSAMIKNGLDRERFNKLELLMKEGIRQRMQEQGDIGTVIEIVEKRSQLKALEKALTEKLKHIISEGYAPELFKVSTSKRASFDNNRIELLSKQLNQTVSPVISEYRIIFPKVNVNKKSEVSMEDLSGIEVERMLSRTKREIRSVEPEYKVLQNTLKEIVNTHDEFSNVIKNGLNLPVYFGEMSMNIIGYTAQRKNYANIIESLINQGIIKDEEELKETKEQISLREMRTP